MSLLFTPCEPVFNNNNKAVKATKQFRAPPYNLPSVMKRVFTSISNDPLLMGRPSGFFSKVISFAAAGVSLRDSKTASALFLKTCQDLQ